MKESYINKYFWLTFVLLSLFFLLLGFYLYLSNKNFMENNNIINTTVINVNKNRITLQYDSDETTTYSFNSYIYKYNINDKVDLYCSVTSCKTKSINEFPLCILCISIFSFILTLILFFKDLFVYGKYDKASNKNGKCIMGKIIDIMVNETIEKDKINPYYIVCAAVNPYTNKEQNFLSDNIWYDVSRVIKDNKITQLPVYIDKNNKENYTVDISILDKYVG